MPEPSGRTSATPPDDLRTQAKAEVPTPAGRKTTLAEAYYHGHLQDLAERSESGDLEQFVLDLFGADQRLVSDAQKRILGEHLLAWTASRSRPIRTRVWKALAACGWVLPVLEILESFPRARRQALLDIDPRVLVEVVEPYLGDRPDRIFPLSARSIEER